MRLTNAICSTAATNKIDGEPIDAHVRVLRTLAKTCNFCTCLQDSLIRDRIFLAVLEGDTRKRLLRQTLKTEVNSRKSKRQRKNPKTRIQRIRTENILTENIRMDGNQQTISRVSSVDESIAKVEPIVPLGAVLLDRVARRTISQANAQRKKKHTKSKKMK